MASFREQVSRNSVALISLAVALLSLTYNTWRNETTEEQRNVRHASFRVLECLGELQQVVDERHFYLTSEQLAAERDSRLRGYGNVTMVRDLMNLMPDPAPESGQALFSEWQVQFAALDDTGPGGNATEAAREAERALTVSINETRQAVVSVLKSLE